MEGGREGMKGGREGQIQSHADQMNVSKRCVTYTQNATLKSLVL